MVHLLQPYVFVSIFVKFLFLFSQVLKVVVMV